MPKVILDKGDIEKLIKDKYGQCEVVFKGKIEAVITLKELPKVAPTVTPARPENIVIPPTKDGQETIPGGPMGNIRGALPRF